MYIEPEHRTLADQLSEATRAGHMGDAYRVLQRVPDKALGPVALLAGYSCIATTNKREFAAHIVSQVAEACRQKTDGYGLRGKNPPAG